MRIHIFGIYGSGKSTLARKLSKILKIKHYELDDLKYKVKYSQIRPVPQRLNRLHKICQKKNWITDSAWTGYAEESFKKADILIMLTTSPFTASYRVLKRHYVTRKIEYENDNLLKQLKIIKNIFKYNLTKGIMSKHAHKEMIKKHGKKVFIIKSKKDLNRLIYYFSNGK